MLEAGKNIPTEYFEAVLRKACPLTGAMMEPDEVAQARHFVNEAGTLVVMPSIAQPVVQSDTS